MESVLHIALALLFAPLLPGLINKVKAFFGARRGPSIFQLYYDLFKLLRKGAVYSTSTSWIFRASPVVGLACVGVALLLTPLLSVPAALRFNGDIFFFVYVLGLLRFFMVLAALDTASAFEGMGASREVLFSALAEIALLAGLAALAVLSHTMSLSSLMAAPWSQAITGYAAALLFIGVAFFLVLLAEAARIPVDDPTTHLELTMIHEAMILDHGGVDLAFIEYTGAVKLWIMGALVVSVVMPWHTGGWQTDLILGIAGLAALAVVVGVVESSMARLKMLRVPQLLIVACIFATLAVGLSLR